MHLSKFVLATSLLVAACGSDSGGGPPGASGGGGGSGGTGATAGDGGLPEAYAPEPGVCRALCCADTDCGDGLKCEAFDAKAGTLGVCAGSAEGGSVNPEAGAPSFPESCWTLTKPECNPLTNEACAAGGACDIGGQGDPDTKPVVSCYYDDNIQGPGEICDNVDGPFCVPGYHCAPK
ncbi:MAG: hypothetical protein IPI67_11160 [Myxococcales bacterium]|nr:hypothetical protein [Myxococcales bacterium]